MKLTSFTRQDGHPSYGIVEGQSIFDIGSVLRNRYPDLKSLIGSGNLSAVEEAKGKAERLPLAAIEFLPVIPNPGKIICIGMNFDEHRVEAGREKTNHPTIFTRFADSQMGHLQPGWISPESSMLDWEGELALVMGKAGRRVPKEKALDYVAGYSCYNDLSVRDWQRHTSQFIPGKNFPRTGAFGPWLVTPDEIPSPLNLSIQTRVNGTQVQNGNTSQMVFPLPELIAYITSFTPLAPGDVIVTGTPSGVGFRRNPQVFLKPGDTTEVEIPGIGVLRTPIVAEPN